MSKLKPLEQWFCDVCHKVIEKPEDGYVTWRVDREDLLSHDFVIIHQTKCDDESRGMSTALPHLLGTTGLIFFLSKIHKNDPHEPDPYRGPHVKDLPEWAELFRRLQLPFYEEARRYWRRSIRDGFPDGANDLLMHSAGYLQGLIEEFEEKDDA